MDRAKIHTRAKRFFFDFASVNVEVAENTNDYL